MSKADSAQERGPQWDQEPWKGRLLKGLLSSRAQVGAGERSEHFLCVTEFCQIISRGRMRTYLASEEAPNSHSQSPFSPGSSLLDD